MLIALSVTAAFCNGAANAASVYWDTNGTSTTNVAAPGGTWVTGSAAWNSDSTGGAGGTISDSTDATSDVVFIAGPGASNGNAAYVITVSDTQSANSLTFQSSGGATLSTGTINLGAGGITAAKYGYGTTNRGAVTINSAMVMQASQSFINNGTNILTLSGGITGTGDLTLQNNNATASGITLSTNPVDNSGAVINAGTAAGSVLISGGLGSHVTGFTQNSAASAATVGATVLGSDFTIASNGAAATTFNGGITGDHNLVLNANSTGGITLSTADVNNGGSITGSGIGSGLVTISSNIGANVTSITQNGAAASKLNLTGNNSNFTGAVYLKSGVLQLGNAAALGGARSLEIDGGSLDASAATTLWSAQAAVQATVSSGTTVTLSDTSNLSVGQFVYGTGIKANTIITAINGNNITLSQSGSNGTVNSMTFGSMVAQAWNGDFGYAGTNDLNVGSGAVTISGDRTVTVNGRTLTVGGAIGDNGSGYSLIKAGAGTLSLFGNNTYGGSTTVNAGTLVLGGSNSYSGGTTINTGGTLTVNNNAALGTGSLVINGGAIGGTATLNVAETWNGSFSFSGGKLTTGTNGKITLTGNVGISSGINDGTQYFTINGNIDDGGNGYSLTLNSAGDFLTLGGSNSFSGGVIIGNTASNTAVAITNNYALGSGTVSIYAGNFKNSNATLSNATVVYGSFGVGSGGLTFNGPMLLGGSGANYQLTSSVGMGSGNITINGIISDGGNGNGLTAYGDTYGYTNLYGANTYTGATIIMGGLRTNLLADGGVASGIGAATSDAGNLVLNGSSAKLTYNGAAVSTNRLFSIGSGGGSIDASGTGPVNFTNPGAMGFNGQTGARTLSLIGSNTGSNTLAAIIGDNGGATSLTKNGTGKWVLTGLSTYSGVTTLKQGVLSTNSLADGGQASGLGASGNLASNLVFSGSGSGIPTLQYTGAAVSTDRLFTIAVSGSTSSFGAILDASGTGAVNFYNTGAMGVSGTGGRTVTLTGNNTGNNTLAAAIIDGNGVTGASGITSLVKSGAGTWLVTSAASNYSGATTISAGTLGVTTLADGGSVSSIGASSNAASNLLLGNGATLQYTGTTASSNRGFTINGTSAGQGATIDASGSGALALTNTASPAYGTTNQSRTLTLAGSNTDDNTLAANIGNNGTSGVVSLVKNGVGKWVLRGANTYTGSTQIQNGTLQIGDGGASGSLSTSSAITDNGVLVFDRSDAISQGTHFSGAAISGSGSLIQAGAGMLTLTATNTYTGSTTIRSGTLAVGASGSIANSAAVYVGREAAFDVQATPGFTVGGGKTLDNQGAVLGAVTVAGTLSGNGSVSNGLSLLDGSTLAMQLHKDSPTGTEYDQMTVLGGDVSLDGTLNLLLNGGTLAVGDGLALIINAGSGNLTGAFSGVTIDGRAVDSYANEMFTYGGREYAFLKMDANNDKIANDLELVAVVPEPGTWAMLLGGLGMLAFGQRLRRRG
ncbi:MAG: autotransporter-associated beta strand repeat-containing protein [Chthoniobacteraceae bacterium]|nr:autotransporter-associated beta strand repeat-containing protein [Chthoniobacteraceae bacterium]